MTSSGEAGKVSITMEEDQRRLRDSIRRPTKCYGTGERRSRQLAGGARALGGTQEVTLKRSGGARRRAWYVAAETDRDEVETRGM